MPIGVAAAVPLPGLVFHPGRGVEFAAEAFRHRLSAARAVQSMSRKGDCWDNAVAESFFSTLEFEGPPTRDWRDAADGHPDLATQVQVETTPPPDRFSVDVKVITVPIAS